MNKDQSAGGKLVDLAFLAAIAWLMYVGKISELPGVLLFAAIAQARGAVGAVSKISSVLGGSPGAGGPPSERPPGPGSSGGMPRVQVPPETPKRDPGSFVRRVAVGAIREESTIGWGLAAFAMSIGGVVSSVARVRHAPLMLAVLVGAVLGCVR